MTTISSDYYCLKAFNLKFKYFSKSLINLNNSQKMLIKTKFLLYSRPLMQSYCLSRLMSNKSQEAKITITNDGQTIVCLHPTKDFPYEHSRPIPESNEALKEEESVLKIQHRIAGQNIFKGSGPDIEETQMLTFTPKHVWKYRPLKRVVPKPSPPRKGI